jgi:adenosine 3'-phospho 5'-phosphosulfate transporter B2
MGKRSISTDSFLREVTNDGLPRSYYGRTNRTPLNLAVCVGGVVGSLCIYGVLQERLMTIPYGGTDEEPETAEMFTSSVFLVLMNRLVTVCVSALGIVLTGDSFKITTPLNLYAAIAFANLVTTVCQVRVARFPNQAARVVAGCPPVHT